MIPLSGGLIRSRATGAILIAAAVAVVLAAGCHGRSQQNASTVGEGRTASYADYLGSDSCSPCHKGECDMYRASRHASAMRPADAAHLGKLAPPSGPIPNSDYAIRESGGAYRFERIDRPEIGAPVQYALGSGRSAITFIGEFGPQRMTEFRMTYLPTSHTWSITPGQESLTDLNLGAVHDMGMVTRCMNCHSVKTQPESGEPPSGFMGVGCESCHGPGRAHVDAVRSGHKSDLKVSDMGKWSAEQVDALCARCHRSIADTTFSGMDMTQTARFQGYGLELSRCYKESGGRLSCVTCHDPHSNVTTDARYYERICLSCHGSIRSGVTRSCPVNPRTGCIPCHMPKRSIFIDPTKQILMSDHLILTRGMNKRLGS